MPGEGTQHEYMDLGVVVVVVVEHGDVASVYARMCVYIYMCVLCMYVCMYACTCIQPKSAGTWPHTKMATHEDGHTRRWPHTHIPTALKSLLSDRNCKKNHNEE